MIVAAEALGYKCYWKTGDWAYNMRLHEKLSLNPDTFITAFLGVGKSVETGCVAKPVERPAYTDHFISIEDVVKPAYPAGAFEVDIPQF